MKVYFQIKSGEDRYNHQLHQIFSIIEKITSEEGGDGCSLVYCDEPDKMADLYENYNKKQSHKMMPYKRHDTLFTDESNENIRFIKCEDPEYSFFHQDTSNAEYSDIFWENKFLITGQY